MGLESATFISQLVSSNPATGDQESQGDDHLRMIKAALQNSFPNASKAFGFPSALVKVANFTVLSTQQNFTFFVDTAGGTITATLPALASTDAGWECFFIKTNTGTSPLLIAPASGTLQSGEVPGLTTSRRCIPGRRTRAVWSGTSFFLERVETDPIGTVKAMWADTVPVGYEACAGSALSSSAAYPDYFLAIGDLTTPDLGGRTVAGKEAVATRLTAAVSGIDGSVVGEDGGSQSFTLAIANLPAHTHGPGTLAGDTSVDGDHNHDYENQSNNNNRDNSGGTNVADDTDVTHSTSTDGNHSHDVDINTGVTGSTGSGTAKGHVQPTLVMLYVLVVE